MKNKNLPYETILRPFNIKTDDITDEGIFTGYGSTFGGKPDSYGDIIAENAFADTIRKDGKFENGISMLVHHNHERPIGKWIELSENKKGLKVVGQLALKTKDGAETYEFMKLDILNSLSIGWEPLKIDSEGIDVPFEDAIEWDDKKGIRTLKKIDLWEMSPILFPANINANITNVKDAIESSKTVREMEHALKEAGLSNNAAKYIAGLVKYKFDLCDVDQNPLRTILKSLRVLNTELMVSGLVNKAINSTEQRDAESEIINMEEKDARKN